MSYVLLDYVALSDFLTLGQALSDPVALYSIVTCVHINHVSPCSFGSVIWTDSGTGASVDFRSYSVVPSGPYLINDFFYGHGTFGYVGEPNTTPYCLKTTSFFDVTA